MRNVITADLFAPTDHPFSLNTCRSDCRRKPHLLHPTSQPPTLLEQVTIPLGNVGMWVLTVVGSYKNVVLKLAYGNLTADLCFSPKMNPSWNMQDN